MIGNKDERKISKMSKVKIDIISGFLGAGKTTLIKKLIKEAYKSENIVLIENEFGEIGVDGGFLKDSGINITEMSQGCICCSLVGDFKKSLTEVIERFSPSRIVIEPSGVGKLSDIIIAVEKIGNEDVELNSFAVVVDAKKCKMYMKNFGEFFNNQVESANCIVVSHTGGLSEEKIVECVELLKQHNQTATIITTSWDALDGSQILDAMEQRSTLNVIIDQLKETVSAEDYDEEEEEEHHHHHHHHHHDEDEDEHEHHHDDDDDDEDEDEHEHHHHHDDDDEDEHEHHHHHDDDDEDEDEHEHHHHHHHHHHHGDDHDADEIFESYGIETPVSYTVDEINAILSELCNAEKYGMVLRAKGIVQEKGSDKWIHFDYVPEEPDVRYGSADIIGKFCVIGSELKYKAIENLFKVK